MIVSFFGGLCLKECEDLLLEKMVRTGDGFKVTHSRCKQRSDQRESVLLVPKDGGFAARLGIYLEKVNTQLGMGKFSGRAWWTGTKGHLLKKMPLGRNLIGNVARDVALRLKLAKPEDYSFHSYRRTSATSAANGGMTSEQMLDFYGWKSANMCQEYISTSGPAIKKMAQTLGNFDLGEPEVELAEPAVVLAEAVVELAEQVVELAEPGPLKEVDVLTEEDLLCFEMKEDPQMYQEAGMSLYTTAIQRSIETTISSIPCVQGANVTAKVCVISNNTGTANF